MSSQPEPFWNRARGRGGGPAALVGVLLAGLAAEARAEGDLVELAQRAKPSVVHIEIEGRKTGEATGFFVTGEGWIATNQHVVEGAHRLVAHLSDGRALEVKRILAEDEAHDVALISVEGQGFPALPLGTSDEVRQGERVVILGNPKGLSFTLSDGIVSALRENGLPEEGRDDARWKQRLLQVTAPISPGSSGSPAMNETGTVIGVAVGGETGGQNLNYLVPVERLRELMATVGPDTVGRELGGLSGLAVNLGVSVAFFLAVVVGAWFVSRPRARKKAAPRPVVN